MPPLRGMLGMQQCTTNLLNQTALVCPSALTPDQTEAVAALQSSRFEGR